MRAHCADSGDDRPAERWEERPASLTCPTEGMMTMQAPPSMAAVQGQKARGRRRRSSSAWVSAMQSGVHCVVSWTAGYRAGGDGGEVSVEAHSAAGWTTRLKC